VGLQNLRRIESLMGQDSSVAYSPVKIRDLLGINYYTVKDVLEYLIFVGRVVKVDSGSKLGTYRWRSG